MKKTGLVAFIAVGAMMLSSCGTSANGKKVAIEAAGQKITMNDVSVVMNAQYGNMMSYYGFDTVRDNTLSSMEQTYKLGEAAKVQNVELTDEEKSQVTSSVASVARNAGGLNAYKKYLEKAGSSYDFIKSYIEESIYANKFYSQLQEENSSEEPTDDQLKDYVVENYYRAKHVLVKNEEDATEEPADETSEEATEGATTEPTEAPKSDKTGKELADEILEKAKNGDDFDQLIKDFSEDPGSESNPDGYIFKEGDMVEPFTECVKNLAENEFGMAESDYGYHVIQRLPLNKDDAAFTTWFDENKDSVKSAYQQKQIDDKAAQICSDNNITITVDDSAAESFAEADMVTPEPTADDTSSAQ